MLESGDMSDVAPEPSAWRTARVAMRLIAGAWSIWRGVLAAFAFVDQQYVLALLRGAGMLLFATMTVWTLRQPPTRKAATDEALVKRLWPDPARLTRIAVISCGWVMATLLSLSLARTEHQSHASVGTVVVGSLLVGAIYLALLLEVWTSAPALAPSLEATPEQLALIAPWPPDLRRWVRADLVSWAIHKKRLLLHIVNEPTERPSRVSIKYYNRADVEELMTWMGLPALTNDRPNAAP
jgi:hypothetical protein